MLFLQIKQAETAIADGRLDEAYQLLQSESLRSHRRGQALTTALVLQLVQRGRLHLVGGRMTQALADCEKAQHLGGSRDDILSLRSDIEGQVLAGDRQRRQTAREGAVATAAALVDSAIGRQDIDRAVAELVRARANGCSDRQLRELDGNVRSTLRTQIESALNEGRLDEAAALMDRLQRLDPEGLATQSLGRAMKTAQSVWNAIEQGRIVEARETLARLSTQLPGVRWIKEAMQHITAAEQTIAALRTGPLGLLALSSAPMFRHDSPTLVPTFREPIASPASRSEAPAMSGQRLPDKFILQVDGAGSCLVVTKPSVTLGPISSSALPDVALITEPSAEVVRIERVEDDYFLKSAASGGSKLLANGDRISISPRCRLGFSVPNPSSTSAALDLVAGRFPRADVRRVILLDRELIIGPGASAHVRADQMPDAVVLRVQDGRLCYGRQVLEIGKTLSVSGVSLAVTIG